MRRYAPRWNSHFGRWVSDFGAGRLVTALQERGEPIHIRTPYRWISGRSSPRHPVALKIVELSGGEVSLDDIYRHRAFASSVPGVRERR